MALGDLAESGNVTPVIDRTYPLREGPDAIRYLEAGHARGKVIVAVRERGPARRSWPAAAGSGDTLTSELGCGQAAA